MIKTKKETGFNITEEDIMSNGLHLGHITSRFNPKMKPYVMGVKNGVHVFDSQKILEKLNESLKFIEKSLKEDKKIILVGTRIPIKNLVKETAQECGIYYINSRWLGGTFTNFETISKRIRHFNELVEKKEKKEFSKYTKKERLKIDQEIKKLEERFSGVKDMDKLPDVAFIVDVQNNELVAREARKKEIKIVGICDTNVNPSSVDYPILGNDDSVSSVEYILGKLKEVILKNKEKE